MTAFKNTSRKVIFAFTLAARPGDRPSESHMMVQAALREAGADTANLTPADAAALRDVAQHMLTAIDVKLLPAQRSALVARYSKDWDARRAACDILKEYFAARLNRILNSWEAVDKLVRRYYLVERDRSGAWSDEQIASANRVNVHDVRQAWQVVALYAEQLERAALDALDHAIPDEVTNV